MTSHVGHRGRAFGCSVLALASVVLAGCGSAGGSVNGKTITYEQANTRVDQLIQYAVAVISPKPRLEAIVFQSGVQQCLGPTDGGSNKRIYVTKNYWLRGVPTDQNVAVATQVKDYWGRQHFLIETATGFDKGQPDISARSYPDDFLLSLSWSADGSLSMGASSPCIWTNGTPPPGS